jgi:hypothetical protein
MWLVFDLSDKNLADWKRRLFTLLFFFLGLGWGPETKKE